MIGRAGLGEEVLAALLQLPQGRAAWEGEISRCWAIPPEQDARPFGDQGQHALASPLAISERSCMSAALRERCGAAVELAEHRSQKSRW